MNTKTLLFSSLLMVPMLALAAPGETGAKTTHSKHLHRYMIERTFPSGALDGLDAKAKAKVNATNAKFGVRWLMSYATADKTKTYCVYEAPDKASILDAAKANAIPVDNVTEVPVTLNP